MSSGSMLRSVGEFVGRVVLGFVAGCALGFVFIVVGEYLGGSGTTGSEYFGYWDPVSAWGLARSFGGPLGAILLPVAYARYLRGRPAGSIFRVGCMAAAATLAGGLLGAAVTMPLAAFTGSAAFLLCCKRMGRRRPVRAPFHFRAEAASGTPAGYDLSA